VNYPKIFVIIPFHNGIEYTLKCLASLKEVDYPNYDIIIVDDGSTDGSVEIISKNYSYVKILKGDGNLWWSGSINLGVKYALEKEADYLVILNNDNIVDKDFLKELVNCAIENPRSIIGSKVYFVNDPKKIRYAGGYFDWENGKILDLHYGEIDEGQFSELKEVEFMGGMGVIIPRSAFEEVGFFDEVNFPQYSGDVDYWLRAKKKGYKILLNPVSVIYDHQDRSGTKNLGSKLSPLYLYKALFSIKSQVNIKMRYKFFKRHCPREYFPKILILFYFTCIKYWLEII